MNAGYMSLGCQVGVAAFLVRVPGAGRGWGRG